MNICLSFLIFFTSKESIYANLTKEAPTLSAANRDRKPGEGESQLTKWFPWAESILVIKCAQEFSSRKVWLKEKGQFVAQRALIYINYWPKRMMWETIAWETNLKA